MVLPHHTQHLLQDVTNLDTAESKRSTLDAQHQMLHLEGENLLIKDRIRLAAALTHKMTSLIAVEFCNCPEEVEKILSVGCVELCYKTCVDEDQLRVKSLTVYFRQL